MVNSCADTIHNALVSVLMVLLYVPLLMLYLVNLFFYVPNETGIYSVMVANIVEALMLIPLPANRCSSFY